jgi:SHS2 domain-containing protein
MVEVRGGDFPDLLANAGYALFDLLTDLDPVTDSQSETVSVEAEEPDEQLADWLRELLYAFHTAGRVCKRFERPHIDGQTVSCVTWGETFDPSRHTARNEIKAVTYHGLSVRKERDGWVATVLFDV